MKILGPLIILFPLLIITSCGGGDDDDGTVIQSEEERTNDLFRTWSNIDAFGPDLDLRGGDFNRSLKHPVTFPNGVICDCSIYINESGTSGSMTFSSCFNLVSDPASFNCSDLNGRYPYERSPVLLRLNCSTNPLCGSYRQL